MQGIGEAVRPIRGKWKPEILVSLADGKLRFGEIKRKIGDPLTAKMLAQQLTQLQADKLISREQFGEVPPRVEYSLTEKGKRLTDVLFALVRWNEGANAN